MSSGATYRAVLKGLGIAWICIGALCLLLLGTGGVLAHAGHPHGAPAKIHASVPATASAVVGIANAAETPQVVPSILSPSSPPTVEPSRASDVDERAPVVWVDAGAPGSSASIEAPTRPAPFACPCMSACGQCASTACCHGLLSPAGLGVWTLAPSRTIWPADLSGWSGLAVAPLPRPPNAMTRLSSPAL